MKQLKAVIMFIAFVILILISYVMISEFLEPRVYNIMTSAFSARSKGSDGIVIVVIDDKSIAKYRWPWSRDKYAKIFNYLGNYADTKVIGFDSVLTSNDDLIKDKKFYDTIKNIDNFVGGFMPLSSEYTDKKTGEKYDERFDNKYGNNNIVLKTKKPNMEVFHSISMYPDGYFKALSKNGSVWVLPHHVDNCVKDAPQFVYYKGNYYPSLSIRMFSYLNHTKSITLTNSHAIIEGEEEIKIPIHKRYGSIFNFLRFYSPYKNSSYTHKTYSAVDIIDSMDAISAGKKPKINPEVFNNKVVFVGANATAAGLYEDVHMTPVNASHPGVDIQATNLDNLMHNEFMNSISEGLEFFMVIILVIATFIIISRFSLIQGLMILVLMIIGYIFMSTLSYKLNFAVPVATPISLQLVTMIFAYSRKFIVESHNKEKIRDAMGKYISKDIMENVVEENIDNIRLGGKKANVTVLFADIRGFTSMSEKLQPDEISVILNEYFTEIEPIISKYNGVINKFIGDAVMAIFGEPIQDKNHAINAVKCADAMLKKVEELQQKWLAEGKPKIEIGVGINTGDAFVGNIGSEKRLEYTVIGDMVNLASRIESYNKVYKTQFLISSYTYQYVRGIADVIKISEVKIRGKAKKLNIYEVLRLTQ
jgi:adenylate cyclase